MTGMPLSRLITGAYPQGMLMKGIPAWTNDERYDVSATASLPAARTPDREQLMMRAMLVDRFQFAAHVETSEQPVFDLLLARRDGRLGPGMTPVEIDCSASNFPPDASGRPSCVASASWSSRRIDSNFTMTSLAVLLQTTVGRPVVDKTGLKEGFRVKLEAEGLMSGGLSATATQSDAPSIFSALPDQLGLKLESSRAMVDTLVVDRIERPSEN
jgi:uncharacterized protein (TIGR03435 family)